MLCVGGYRMTGPPLHWDEGATLAAAERSIPDLLRLLRNLDAVLGPYYLFVKVTIVLFGESDLVLRLPSLLALSLGVGFVAESGRRLAGLGVGLVAGPICAMLPAMTLFGVEARPYGFVFLFATLATLTFYGAMADSSPKAWTAYAACLFATGALHIVAAVLVLPHLLILMRRRAVLGRRGWINALVAVGSATAGLIPLALVGAAHRDAQLGWVTRPNLETLTNLGRDVVGSTLGGCLLLALAVAAVWAGPRTLSLELSCLVAAPILAILAISVIGPPLWVGRYVLFVLGPMSILSALAVARRVRLRPAIAAAAVTALFFAVVQVQQTVHRSKGAADTRAMAAVIQTQSQPGDVIVFGDYTLRPLVFHYLGESSTPSARTPVDVLMTISPSDLGHFNAGECVDVAACLAGRGRVWLATSLLVDGDEPLNQPTPKMVALRDGYLVAERWQLGFGTLTLLVANPR